MKRVLGGLCILLACTRTSELVDPVAVDAGDAQLPADAAEASLPPWPDAGTAVCGDRVCACSNGLDDDGDGRADGMDPECTAPFDDHEDSFAIGVHGEQQDKRCQDCFFDDDSGGMECRRARSCATDGTASSGTGACRSCDVSSACTDSCLPRVPNGCDCFGCCEVWRDGAPVAHVLLEATCTLAALGDPTLCAPCTPVPTCQNPCGECELCTGRSESDLPASCAGVVCEGGSACSRSEDCAGSTYCHQGCCLVQGI